jgi:hypothetical protein
VGNIEPYFARGLSVNRNFIIASILVLSLALRLLYVTFADRGRFRNEGLYSDDARQYAALADALRDGRGFELDGGLTSWRAPLYPSLLAGIRRFLPRPVLAARILQCFLGAALTLVVLLLATRLRGTAAGCLAAAFCALTYELIDLNAYLVTETVFALLHAVSILALVLYRQTGRPRWVIYGGVALGLAILTRAQPLLFPLFAMAWFALPTGTARRGAAVARRKIGQDQLDQQDSPSHPVDPVNPVEKARIPRTVLRVGETRGREPAGLTRLRHGLLFAGIAYLVVSPWTLRNAVVHGSFVPVTTELGKLVYQANCTTATGGTGGWYKRAIDWTEPPNRDGDTEVARSRRMLRAGLRYAATHPGRTLRLVPKKFWNMWRPWTAGSSTASTITASAQYLLLMALYGWGLWRLRRRWRSFAILHLPVAYSLALHTILSSTVRYRYPLLPLIMVVAACGICENRMHPAAQHESPTE